MDGERPQVDGRCDPRFALVRDAFAQNFDDLGELGAALHVRVDGRTVADLWGGYADAARTRRWDARTLVNVYSVGKGVLAALALSLVERGTIGLDTPVAKVWPEFGAEGKHTVTLRTLLAHRAGLPAVRRRLPEGAMLDWRLMCGELASQKPYWQPETAHGYHVNTLGYLAGETLARASGRDVNALLQALLAPLGAEFWWGLPPGQHARVAEVVAPDIPVTGPERWAQAMPSTGDAERDLMVWHAYFNPGSLSGHGAVNTPPWREACVPSTNGHASARGVAAIYDALLHGAPDGARIVGPALLAEATRIHSDGEDRVLGRPSRFGLGFQLASPSRPIGGTPDAFGHYGYGGSLGFADPASGVAFAYLTNKPWSQRWQAPRTQRLIDAVYACLGQ